MPTIGQVASRAGVSKSLVSLVMRGGPHVSDERRQAVLDAARDLGYRPNAMARSLVERRTRTVGVVIADLSNPWFVDLLEGLRSVLHGSGMRVLLGDGRLSRETDESLSQAFLELRVEGLCLVGSLPQSDVIGEAARAVPTVIAGGRELRLARVDVVTNDDLHGAALAVDHLVELGHVDIAHIGGLGGATAEVRRLGYEETMTRHGLESYVTVAPADFTERSGYEAALLLLCRRPRPTAIFALNDVACIGALSAADELGIAVPGELSLVGYDNTHLAAIRHLSLTTVDPVNKEVGRIAGRLLLERIKEPRRVAREHLVEPDLAIRGSTSAPFREASGDLRRRRAPVTGLPDRARAR
ncbi:MAG: LacI family DNA-binding transcriptional regulator [Acidimicrobiales bacterium]